MFVIFPTKPQQFHAHVLRKLSKEFPKVSEVLEYIRNRLDKTEGPKSSSEAAKQANSRLLENFLDRVVYYLGKCSEDC